MPENALFSIDLQNVSKSYNNKILFENLTQKFEVGEKWAILGENGSGKSTFSLLLSHQIIPTTGTCKWFDTEKEINPEKVYKYYALASPAQELIEEFSLTELFKFHFSLKEALIKDPLQTTAEICHFSTQTLKVPIGNFSSGMKQRVKLCLAFFTKVPMLVLDEPLTNLDAKGIELYNYLVQNFAQNRLLIVASNREDEYHFCDKSLNISRR